jgi:hypothetical protein
MKQIYVNATPKIIIIMNHNAGHSPEYEAVH